MKNLFIVITLFTFNILIAQGGGAYKQLQVPEDNISQSLQYWGKKNQNNQKTYRTNKRAKKNNDKKEAYNLNKTFAIQAYEENKFTNCIKYFNIAKKLGYYDSYFEYITGVSYYKIYQQTKQDKYKKRAKKLLKLSKRHGNIDAELLLDKHF